MNWRARKKNWKKANLWRTHRNGWRSFNGSNKSLRAMWIYEGKKPARGWIGVRKRKVSF